MPSVKFVLRHETVFGYQVFMHIDEWSGLHPMMCVHNSSPITWETTLNCNLHTKINYKYYFSRPNEEKRFYEDGSNREYIVYDQFSTCVDNWRQTGEHYFDSEFFGPEKNRIHRANTHYPTITARIWFFPGDKTVAQKCGSIPLEVHINRVITPESSNRSVWEKYLFFMDRNNDRFEVKGLPLNINDDFWNVGKIILVNVKPILPNFDQNGNITNKFYGSRENSIFQIYNRPEDWVGKRIYFTESDNYERSIFHGENLNVTQKPFIYCNFTRREGCRHSILHLINTSKNSIFASIYNINDPEVTDALIAARNRGVNIKILTSSKMMSREWQFNEQYKKLIRENMNIIGIIHDNPNPELRAVTNHTKFAIFDHTKVVTGSCNWEIRAFDSNSENIVVIEHSKVAEYYMCVFSAIQGFHPTHFPHNHSDSLVKVYYSRTWSRSIVRPVCTAIDRAKTRIDIAMFIIRKLKDYESGTEWDLFRSLKNAHSRGVEIWIVLEGNTHDGGRYRDRHLPHDKEHEELIHHGIKCIKMRPVYHNDPCSAMHHKFIVIDSHITITGSFNLWGPSLVSDDDFVFINDHGIARQHQGEIERLLRWYKPEQAENFCRSLHG